MKEQIYISAEEFQILNELWSAISMNDVETEKFKKLHAELERLKKLRVEE